MPLAVLAAFRVWADRDDGVVAWPSISTELADAQTFLTVTFVGLAAWRGSVARSFWRSLAEGTTVGAGTRHLLHAFSSTVAWGISTYAGIVAIVVAMFLPLDPWGVPDSAIIGAAWLSVAAAAAIGFVCGLALPYPFTPPLLAFGWWLTDGLVASRSGPVQFLVPRALYENVRSSIFIYPTPDGVAVWQLLLWIAITGSCAFVVHMLGRSRGVRQMVSPTIALLIITLPARELLSVDATQAARIRPASLTCQGDAPRVCVHEAQGRLIPDVMRTIQAVYSLLEPVPELPNEVHEAVPGGAESGLTFSLSDRNSVGGMLASEVIIKLVNGERYAFGQPSSWVQAVVAGWLLQASGMAVPFPPEALLSLTSEFRAAMEQQPISGPTDEQPMTQLQERFRDQIGDFAALDPAERGAWLATHWTALVNGEVKADELPE